MKQHTESELLHLAASYCSVAERCILDVRQKIVVAGATPEMEEQIISRLLNEKFIDESRYCLSFVKDKLRFNRWGRIKITYELRTKNIPAQMISEAIHQIDDEAYETTLYTLLKDKKRTAKGSNDRDIFNKLYRFAAGRGFESDLTVQQLKKLFKKDFDEDMDF
ncbi:MAG: RecX family transcriptional regulator [Tannerella sp.]|jgi:regulatory protein|nr:RecX family transcriptional regulator [Tannerella sp.]